MVNDSITTWWDLVVLASILSHNDMRIAPFLWLICDLHIHEKDEKCVLRVYCGATGLPCCKMSTDSITTWWDLVVFPTIYSHNMHIIDAVHWLICDLHIHERMKSVFYESSVPGATGLPCCKMSTDSITTWWDLVVFPTIYSHNMRIIVLHWVICDLLIHEKDGKCVLRVYCGATGLQGLKWVLIPSQLDGI